MRILLLGEYSNVHATLASGLRQLGHHVVVASNGDFWKDYPRDIDLARRPGKLGGLSLMAKVYSYLPQWRGFDVVQLINPMFLELKAERLFPIYRYLRRHNGKMVLGAMGMDWYWVHECTYAKPLRYSDFNIGNRVRNDDEAEKYRHDWLCTKKGDLNRMVAADCDAIVSVLYEDHVCYLPYFPEKLHFIPLPIQMPEAHAKPEGWQPPLKVFIGISKGRSVYKGTDVMLRAAEDVMKRYPGKMTLMKAEGVPFTQYQHMMDGADAILDQLYSYSPSMNPLLAMSKGIICIGGGEPENYQILGEKELQPIINIEPSYDSVYRELENLLLHPEKIDLLKGQSIAYVRRHHDFIKVARQYERLYMSI